MNKNPWVPKKRRARGSLGSPRPSQRLCPMLSPSSGLTVPLRGGLISAPSPAANLASLACQHGQAWPMTIREVPLRTSRPSEQRHRILCRDTKLSVNDQVWGPTAAAAHTPRPCHPPGQASAGPQLSGRRSTGAQPATDKNQGIREKQQLLSASPETESG